MKKALLIGCVGVPLLLMVIGIIAVIALPSEYDVSTSLVVNSDAAKIYPHVNNLKNWQNWTVWTNEKYPDMETVYSGPEEGVGAQSSWSGTESGVGSMEITQSSPETGIHYTLRFADFPDSQGQVTFHSLGSGTEVTMAMHGEMPGVAKLMTPLMKPAMKAEFDACLERLKTLVEGG